MFQIVSNNRVLCIAILAATLWVGPSLFASTSAKTTLDDPVASEKVVKTVAATHSALSKKLSRILRRYNPVIVFLPGILGSKLTTKDGKVAWGKTGYSMVNSEAAKRLSYCDSPKLIASTLTHLEASIVDADVYGNWLNVLEKFKYIHGKKYLVVPYDWRGRIEESSKTLGEHLKKAIDSKNIDLTGRYVIFVAHSMGGLVFSHWYANNYLVDQGSPTPQYKFKVARVYFLGTPHDGAPSSLKVLMEGYDPTFNPLINLIASPLLRPLNMVGHTFPGLYQLLPPFDQKFILVTDGSSSGLKQHLIPENWGPDKFIKPLEKGTLACGVLGDRLKEAIAFHDSLVTVPPPDFDFVYFYNDTVKTPAILQIKISEETSLFSSVKELKIEQEWIPSKLGDGRVLKYSAMNISRDTTSTTNLYANKTHGYLADSINFQKNLKEFLERFRYFRDRAVREIDQDGVILSAMQKNKVETVLWLRGDQEPTPDCDVVLQKVKKTFSDPTVRAMVQELLTSDEQIISLDLDEAVQAIFEQTFGHKNQTIEGRSDRIQKYLLTVLFSDFGSTWNLAAALNNLGHMALQENNNNLAFCWLKRAVEIAPIRKDKTVDRDLMAQIVNNLGVAYFRLKRYKEARIEFEKVIFLGKVTVEIKAGIIKKAKKNLIDTKARLAKKI